MVATVCLSTPSTWRFRREARSGDCYSSAAAGGGGAGRWSSSSSIERGGGTRGALCNSSSAVVATLMSAMDVGILSSAFGRFNLTRRETTTGRILRGPRVKCIIAEAGRFPNELSFGRAKRGPTEVVLSRKRHRGFLGGLIRCRRWRARAAAEDDEEDPPGEEKYWEGAEGKQQMKDIEDMKELIAEAESLRRAESAGRGPGELTSEEIEKQRAEKLREELARRAKQQAEQRKQAEIMFGMGQRAYGRGVYDKSVELLEAALSNVPGSSNFGGEIQIWLAMAYEAHNRHGDCIALYRRIEATHPSKQIRRQAADLRYILEAPKLKISREEMVSIPIIERDYDRGSKTWSQKIRDRRRKPMPKSKSKDYLEDWLVWDPPRWERSPYFWVAFTVWLTLVGVSLMFQD